MLKIYGRDDCPDCVACKASFDEAGLEYDFRDIGKSLKDMAVFIKIRDINEVFDEIVEAGKIGIPALVFEDRSVTLDWEEYLEEEGYLIEKSPSSCSVDGSGC
ncbi:Glutaredoxin-related protein [Pseudobutyrivibrio sp. 49]|uniref:glutaredoxin domain-containing protein n=1 Tax=Pseudobutyrivibrio sp. 49 TaxID=1855344 RepID=UPI000885D0FD|nr:glutaredoxin domain-containing protein [Pseudobutyrivibrio sp. 49]SDI87784.1 Glutaredoxin-related protein [Pseudobutyrivibrio sp. 49]